MWRNFFSKPAGGKAWMGLTLPIWVVASFVLAQVIVGLLITLVRVLGVSFDGINVTILSTVLTAVIYVIAIVIVIGLPWIIKKYRTSRAELGLTRYPEWLDLLLAPAGFVVYILLSALFMAFAMSYMTFIDFDQVQETGFSQLGPRFEYILAFVALVVLAPVAEEILFRGYLFGKLQKNVATWIAVLITSVVFAAVHLAWNVGIDVFALSIVLCLLRIVSNSLWPSILLHMLKNGIAFYFLFINPYILTTLGG